MSRRTLTLGPDTIERDITVGLSHVGTITYRAVPRGWTASDAEGAVIGVYDTADAAGRAVLAAWRALRNREGR